MTLVQSGESERDNGDRIYPNSTRMGLEWTQAGKGELVRVLVVCIMLIGGIYTRMDAFAQTVCSVPSPNSMGARGKTKNEGLQQAGGMDTLRTLIEQRLSLMTDVARAKWNTGSAIEDPVREQQLLADIAVKSQSIGISSEWAKHFFRFQIEAAKEVQYCLFAQWTAQRRGSFADVPDLRSAIRPKLDRLTGELLKDLAREWPGLRRRLPAQKHSPLCELPTNETAICLALLPLSDGSIDSSGP
jgi:chorismate mutase-like protein